MKKLAANYVIQDTWKFLKNGIMVVSDEGMVTEYIDQCDDLRELARLAYYNGILIAGYCYTKSGSPSFIPTHPTKLQSMISEMINTHDQVFAGTVIDWGKLIQSQFPEMTIPEILKTIIFELENTFAYNKTMLPEVYLIQPADLLGLHFTESSNLIKLL